MTRDHRERLGHATMSHRYQRAGAAIARYAEQPALRRQRRACLHLLQTASEDEGIPPSTHHADRSGMLNQVSAISCGMLLPLVLAASMTIGVCANSSSNRTGAR